MKKSALVKAAATLSAGALGTVFAKKKIKDYISEPENKRKLSDFGNNAVNAAVGSVADRIADRDIPYLNRYDNCGFLEGSGYFLSAPKNDARWSLGFAKASILPENFDKGEYYIGGYLAFPPNRLSGIMTDQLIRVFAIDDNSDRGINVFAVIDCIGISNTDIRAIRLLLREFINEKNIVSINISATHCHSGIDTQGMWGNLTEALRKNPAALKAGKPDETVSGRNAAFMENLHNVCADAIRRAVDSMEPGRLYFTTCDIADYVRDKRPPYVTDNILTALKFIPDSNNPSTLSVFMAAHPVCYGDKQRVASADYPYYLCKKIEDNGINALFFQGAEAAVATERGKVTPEGATHNEGIEAYGESLAEKVCSVPQTGYSEIKPMLNVILKELFLPADNRILELAGKMRLVNNNMTKVSMDSDEFDMHFATEIGYAEFGDELKLALIPGELMPEILTGGVFSAQESYNGTDWNYKAMRDMVNGQLNVIGLCNDSIGYIVPDNDFGSIFAPLHYEEAVSAGKRTASNIVSAFMRLLETADKLRLSDFQLNMK